METIFATLDAREESLMSHLKSTEPESSVWERIGLAALIIAAPLTVFAAALSIYFASRAA